MGRLDQLIPSIFSDSSQKPRECTMVRSVRPKPQASEVWGASTL
jgi:hypothetical protein